MQGKCGPRQPIQPQVASPASLTKEGDRRSISRRQAMRRRGRRDEGNEASRATTDRSQGCKGASWHDGFMEGNASQYLREGTGAAGEELSSTNGRLGGWRNDDKQSGRVCEIQAAVDCLVARSAQYSHCHLSGPISSSFDLRSTKHRSLAYETRLTNTRSRRNAVVEGGWRAKADGGSNLSMSVADTARSVSALALVPNSWSDRHWTGEEPRDERTEVGSRQTRG
jgi:hypothetical protein